MDQNVISVCSHHTKALCVQLFPHLRHRKDYKIVQGRCLRRTSLPKRRSALLLELIRAKEQCDDSGCPEDLPSSMHMRTVNVLKEMLSRDLPWSPVVSHGLCWSPVVSHGLCWSPVVSHALCWSPDPVV